MPANPPHSFDYASGLPPQSDEKIYANLRVYFISDSLDDNGRFQIVGFLCAIVFDLRTFVLAKVVKTQTILLQIDDVKQCEFQLLALSRVDLAFKDGVLHALSIGATFACDLT